MSNIVKSHIYLGIFLEAWCQLKSGELAYCYRKSQKWYDLEVFIIYHDFYLLFNAGLVDGWGKIEGAHTHAPHFSLCQKL